MEITYSIVHHRSGSEYLAEFVGGGVARATEIDSCEVASIDRSRAIDWLDNQHADVLDDTASDLNRWIEAMDAWIIRSPLDPGLR